MLLTGVVLWALGLASARGDGSTDRPPQGAPAGDTSARRMSQDLHLSAGVFQNETIASGQSLLLCREGFSMIVGNRKYAADRALVWTTVLPSEQKGPTSRSRVRVYLGGGVSDRRLGDRTQVDFDEVVLKRGEAVAIGVDLAGEVFITGDRDTTENLRSLPFYQEAAAAFEKAGLGPSPSSQRIDRAAPATKSRAIEIKKPTAGYTISVSPLGEVAPKYEQGGSEQGEEIITFIGRSYVSWQEPNDLNGQESQIGLEADCVVVWRAGGRPGQAPGATTVRPAGVRAVYVSGDVVLTQGQRMIRAEELYYDLQNDRALAKNVVFRSFDPVRNIPVYIRARELRQVAVDTFEADGVRLTSSEFWKPQLSAEADTIRVVDRRLEGDPNAPPSGGEFEAELKDVRFKLDDITLLRVPKVRSTGVRPELPIRSISVGHDSTYGTSIETAWWLSRLLGLRRPEGTDGSLLLDYYGQRGVGGGVDLRYEREDYFGSVLGYAIEDHGEDRLSRTRKNVDVPDETRGRFSFQHRHFLPYGWQMTAEVGYLSDENFLEQFYRTEFNVGKEQETLLHFKRIEDNWGLSFLGKTRINDFVDQVEELPTAEYHLMGQSLLNDRLTFYSDNQASRYRYRFDPDNPVKEPGDFFTFMGTRNEVDMPLKAGAFKVVPFVAGTLGYEDGAGFDAELDGGTAENEDAIAIGEAGVRASMHPFWCVYPDVESRLWDLHQLRHLVRPSITAVSYFAGDAVAEQRDTLDFGISQRWQTKRGPAGRRRTVDWIDLDLDYVWVGDSSDEIAGPDRFLWNEPFIPLVNRDGRVIPPLDRRATDLYGPRQNYASAEMILRLTDTTSLVGDLYYDVQNGVVEQLDVGFSRLCWPNLSYYVGSRYLREVDNTLGQKGSNSLTFAASYVLDPRYTVVLSEQFDFDYGSNVQTNVALIRKYHRMNLALTFSVDDSMDERRFVLSLWPEGIPELGFGMRRYMELGASDVYH